MASKKLEENLNLLRKIKLQGVNENIDGMVYQFKKEANGKSNLL